MSGLNKGEWNEFYTILYLLNNSNLNIVDSNLNVIDQSTFEINEVKTQGETTLVYKNIGDNICIFLNNENVGKVSNIDLLKTKDYLLNILRDRTPLGGGSIELPLINKFADNFTLGYSIKGKSNSKADIGANVKDKKRIKNVELTYSIKSQFTSPATLLNSSTHTNFKYKIDNFDLNKMEKINRIKTKSKLLDRISMINELGGIISFSEIESMTFSKNLKLIDSSMDKLIANALLFSYTHNEKDLQNAFFKANSNEDPIFLRKKLIDFLYGMCFGFFPSKVWDGKYSVTGGIMITKNSGNVVLLDKIYHNAELEDYLYNSSKFDSPSSSRYHMLEVFEENGNFYFTLNLQIRSKK